MLASRIKHLLMEQGIDWILPVDVHTDHRGLLAASPSSSSSKRGLLWTFAAAEDPDVFFKHQPGTSGGTDVKENHKI